MKIERVHAALMLSLGVHAGLLCLRVASPETFNRIFQDTPLEVVLVNTNAKGSPVKAQAKAQASLLGGGNQEKGLSTTPLAPDETETPGQSLEELRSAQARLEKEQELLLSQRRRDFAVVQKPKVSRTDNNDAARAQIEQHRLRVRQFAAIERRVNTENARPRKRYISADTEEVVYALYYDTMRKRIEDRGTRDWPVQRGQRIYGQVTMNIHVDSQGRVLDTELLVSSGNPVLDKRATAIAYGSAPFGNFSKEMLKDADMLIMTARFNFDPGGAFEASLAAHP